jgi:hypothetical protein
MTMKDLLDRKQNVKAMMYKKLWWCILASILVIFGFFFINSFSFAGRSDPDFVPNNWKTRWFILDGWLNLVYLVDIAYVAYLWRPTANNRRFAMSDEASYSAIWPVWNFMLTPNHRLHKMMRALKLPPLVARSTMKKQTLLPKTAIELRGGLSGMANRPRINQQLAITGNLLTESRSLPSVKMLINGRTMMNLPAIQRSVPV